MIVKAVRKGVQATNDYITEGGVVDMFPLEHVAVVFCANFTIDDKLQLADFGERRRFH